MLEYAFAYRKSSIFVNLIIIIRQIKNVDFTCGGIIMPVSYKKPWNLPIDKDNFFDTGEDAYE